MARRLPVLLLALALAACEAPLDPIEPSDLVFAMSGYLDVTADTQFVRVEPFAREAVSTPGPIDATVELVDPDGDRHLMTQLVRDFPTGPGHLFWTTTPIEAGATYRIVATDAAGATATATVRTPDDADLAFELIDGPLFCPTLVAVSGATRVVDVQARYRLEGPGRVGERYRFSKLESLMQSAAGTLDATVYFGDDADFMEIDGLPGAYPVAAEFAVAVGTDDWPDVEGLTLEGALAAAELGNVEHGTGFVGGVITRAIPFRPGYGLIPPFEDSGVEPEPCNSE
ncbi:hypothetical protein [Rubrivirga sp. IMCC43871]|uniref:hypothetical protein n=1 Tax=Rubrivirga sp. IMCC43871 TaxID=3391575 RepID=UPI00398FE47F